MPDALRFGAPRSSRSNRHSIEKMQQEEELTVSTKLARQEIYCSEACSWRVCDQTNKPLTVQQPRSNPSKLPKCWEKRYGENTAIEGVLHILATFSKLSARLHTAEVAGSNPASPTSKKQLFAGLSKDGRLVVGLRGVTALQARPRWNPGSDGRKRHAADEPRSGAGSLGA